MTRQNVSEGVPAYPFFREFFDFISGPSVVFTTENQRMPGSGNGRQDVTHCGHSRAVFAEGKCQPGRCTLFVFVQSQANLRIKPESCPHERKILSVNLFGGYATARKCVSIFEPGSERIIMNSSDISVYHDTGDDKRPGKHLHNCICSPGPSDLYNSSGHIHPERFSVSYPNFTLLSMLKSFPFIWSSSSRALFISDSLRNSFSASSSPRCV